MGWYSNIRETEEYKNVGIVKSVNLVCLVIIPCVKWDYCFNLVVDFYLNIYLFLF